MTSSTLGNLDIVASHLLSLLSQKTLPSNPLDCGKISMTKFKMPLQKEFLQVGEVLVILTGEKSCHSQGLHSAVYALVSMYYGEVTCLLMVNGDGHLFRELEYRLVPGHVERSVWILKSLELHEIIMRDQ